MRPRHRAAYYHLVYHTTRDFFALAVFPHTPYARRGPPARGRDDVGIRSGSRSRMSRESSRRREAPRRASKTFLLGPYFERSRRWGSATPGAHRRRCVQAAGQPSRMPDRRPSAACSCVFCLHEQHSAACAIAGVVTASIPKGAAARTGDDPPGIVAQSMFDGVNRRWRLIQNVSRCAFQSNVGCCPVSSSTSHHA